MNFMEIACWIDNFYSDISVEVRYWSVEVRYWLWTGPCRLLLSFTQAGHVGRQYGLVVIAAQKPDRVGCFVRYLKFSIACGLQVSFKKSKQEMFVGFCAPMLVPSL